MKFVTVRQTGLPEVDTRRLLYPVSNVTLNQVNLVMLFVKPP